MATTKAIRDRIYNLLNNMAAISGTTKTTAQYIPQNVQDFEGYVFRVRMTGASPITRPYRESRTEPQSWEIELFSPSVNIGFSDAKENAMYDYRDAVLDAFQRLTSLQLNDSGVVGVSGALITSDRFTWGTSEFFETLRYKWQCTLSLTNEVICE